MTSSRSLGVKLDDHSSRFDESVDQNRGGTHERSCIRRGEFATKNKGANLLRHQHAERHDSWCGH